MNICIKVIYGYDRIQFSVKLKHSMSLLNVRYENNNFVCMEAHKVLCWEEKGDNLFDMFM